MNLMSKVLKWVVFLLELTKKYLDLYGSYGKVLLDLKSVQNLTLKSKEAHHNAKRLILLIMLFL